MRKKSNESTNHIPKQLGRNIKLANLVPFNAEINISSYDFEYDEGANYDELPQIWFECWAEKHNIRQYPKLFRYLSSLNQRKYLFFKPFEEFMRVRDFMKVLVEIAEEYQGVIEKRLKLIKLAEASKNKAIQDFAKTKFFEKPFIIGHSTSTNRDSIEKKLYMQSDDKKNNLGKSLFEFGIKSSWLTVNENHHVEIVQGKLLDSIKGIDLRRLKKCKSCSGILWAFRLNAKYCSKRCSNRYHQQLLHTDPEKRAKINKKRRENYKHNNKLKKMRSTKNGNL